MRSLARLLFIPLTLCSAHFSVPGGAIGRHHRVIDVTSMSTPPLSRRRVRSLLPLAHRSDKNWNLYAEAVVEEGEEEIEEIPSDYEEVVPETPAKASKTVKSFKELGFFGKLVRGTKNIVTATTVNFGLGVSFGLVTGGIRGFPNLMTRKEGLLGTPWKEEIPLRWKRYSGKCYRWARIWGPVFAIWGFTDTTVSLLRNGANDEWNFMLASSAAAVWHNRDKSMTRKVAVGIIYAILTYGYVKVNEYFVIGPEGWQEKYNRDETAEDTVAMGARSTQDQTGAMMDDTVLTLGDSISSETAPLASTNVDA